MAFWAANKFWRNFLLEFLSFTTYSTCRWWHALDTTKLKVIYLPKFINTILNDRYFCTYAIKRFAHDESTTSFRVLHQWCTTSTALILSFAHFLLLSLTWSTFNPTTSMFLQALHKSSSAIQSTWPVNLASSVMAVGRVSRGLNRLLPFS